MADWGAASTDAVPDLAEGGRVRAEPGGGRPSDRRAHRIGQTRPGIVFRLRNYPSAVIAHESLLPLSSRTGIRPSTQKRTSKSDSWYSSSTGASLPPGMSRGDSLTRQWKLMELLEQR